MPHESKFTPEQNLIHAIDLGVDVDDEDLHLLSEYRWHSHTQDRNDSVRVLTTFWVDALTPELALYEVPTKQRQTSLALNRLVLGLKLYQPVRVIHVNGNGLDCRKGNLIVVPIRRSGRRGYSKVHIRADQHQASDGC